MYHLLLTDREVDTLAWLTERGYFPKSIYDDMALADGEPEHNAMTDCDPLPPMIVRKWVFSESAAWGLPELQRDDPGAYLSCLGGDLLDKVNALAERII
jgi:hypothetical protein